MAQLAHPDHSFLERRRAKRGVGLYGLPAALVGLLLGWIALWSFWPLSVNPFTVVGQIEQQNLEPGTLTMYAVTATVLMNVLLGLSAVFLLIGILWARHERRYQRILERPENPAKPT